LRRPEATGLTTPGPRARRRCPLGANQQAHKRYRRSKDQEETRDERQGVVAS
jgi:hypothetical protein